jgi:hypothetical protein
MATAFSTTLVPDWSVKPHVCKDGAEYRKRNKKYSGDLAGRHKQELSFKPDRKPTLAEYIKQEIIQEEFENIKKRNGWK